MGDPRSFHTAHRGSHIRRSMAVRRSPNVEATAEKQVLQSMGTTRNDDESDHRSRLEHQLLQVAVKTEKVIHLCDEGSQPSIRIACSWKWTTPAWAPSPTIYANNVYYDDEGDLYTFSDELVTCQQCIARYPKRTQG